MQFVKNDNFPQELGFILAPHIYFNQTSSFLIAQSAGVIKSSLTSSVVVERGL